MHLDLPQSGEFPDYFSGYINRVKPGDWKLLHQNNTQTVVGFFQSIPENLGTKSYAPGKWTIETILKHLIDTERIFAYRALVAARNDRNILLQSYNDDEYAASFSNHDRTLHELVEEFMHVRKSNFHFFQSLSNEQWNQKARTEKGDLSLKACFFILLGHPLHHMEVIQQRYLQ